VPLAESARITVFVIFKGYPAGNITLPSVNSVNREVVLDRFDLTRVYGFSTKRTTD
jgi:hypothetical protein